MAYTYNGLPPYDPQAAPTFNPGPGWNPAPPGWNPAPGGGPIFQPAPPHVPQQPPGPSGPGPIFQPTSGGQWQPAPGAPNQWQTAPHQSEFARQRAAYFGGDPRAYLAQLGFSMSTNPNGPAGTTFTRNGQSYTNVGASHEGAGFGGQSAFLAGQGFAPSASMAHLSANRQYGGQLGMADKAMAAVAQGNLHDRIASMTPADKAALATSGRDIFGNPVGGGAVGGHPLGGGGFAYTPKTVPGVVGAAPHDAVGNSGGIVGPNNRPPTATASGPMRPQATQKVRR